MLATRVGLRGSGGGSATTSHTHSARSCMGPTILGSGIAADQSQLREAIPGTCRPSYRLFCPALCCPNYSSEAPTTLEVSTNRALGQRPSQFAWAGLLTTPSNKEMVRPAIYGGALVRSGLRQPDVVSITNETWHGQHCMPNRDSACALRSKVQYDSDEKAS